MYVNKKAQQAEQTRALLERTARELFEARGYASVSAEELVTAAGVTRGALYHHYDGKQGLFEAVVVAAMRRLHDHVGQAAADAPDAFAGLRTGIHRFLELSSAPRVQRVLFVDAPAVMGWQRWRELDSRYGLGLLKQGIGIAIASGQMRRQPVDLAAHVLLSAMIEVAMLIAAADHKAQAREEAEAILLRLLTSLS